MTLSEIITKANLFLSAADFSQAENLAREALREELDNIEALEIKAIACRALGKYQSAAISFSQLGMILESGLFYEKSGDAFQAALDAENARESYQLALLKMQDANQLNEMYRVRKKITFLNREE